MEFQNFLVFGFLIFGCIIKGFTKPLLENNNNNNNGSNNNTTEHYDEKDVQNDYSENDYNDDENNSMSDNVSTMTTQTTKLTDPPYLEKKEYIKQMKPGTNITLECPAKNLGPSNVILWYKEDKVIAAGEKPVGDRYNFDVNVKSLTIFNATERDSGNYYCEVQPQKLRIHVNLEVSEISNYAEAQSHSMSLRPSSSSVSILSFCSLSSIITVVLLRI